MSRISKELLNSTVTRQFNLKIGKGRDAPTFHCRGEAEGK